MNYREKRLLIVAIILFVIVFVKSFFLDEVKNLSPEEAEFKVYVEKVIAEKHDNIFDKIKIVGYRVIDISEITEFDLTSLRKINKFSEEEIEKILEGKYKGKVRKYFLYTIPFGDEKIIKMPN